MITDHTLCDMIDDHHDFLDPYPQEIIGCNVEDEASAGELENIRQNSLDVVETAS